MHGPESWGSLFRGTKRGFGGLPCLGMDGVEWVLDENVLDFASGDIRFIQKRARL
ncbi:MAG: hypothetical protein J7M16_13005 [Anaerolineae bacterium]|nr:hypothetical protein [Anaerolineae bacterium]